MSFLDFYIATTSWLYVFLTVSLIGYFFPIAILLTHKPLGIFYFQSYDYLYQISPYSKQFDATAHEW